MTRNFAKLAVLLLLLVTGVVAEAGTITYVYTDPQGTPLAEANPSGNVTATFDYHPYGAQALGGKPNGPGYTGHVDDPATGLVYMQARYYDPVSGRFLSVDPSSASNVASTTNRYWYGNNNPVRFIDPDGRQSFGYGTNQPDRILDCHQTNSCVSLSEADAMVRRDAKLFLTIQGGAAAAGGGTAVVVAAAPTAAVLVRSNATKQIICAALALRCSSEALNPADPKFDPLNPEVESQLVDQTREIEELWRRVFEYIKQRQTTPTEPVPKTPPQTSPPLPAPKPTPPSPEPMPSTLTASRAFHGRS